MIRKSFLRPHLWRSIAGTMVPKLRRYHRAGIAGFRAAALMAMVTSASADVIYDVTVDYEHFQVGGFYVYQFSMDFANVQATYTGADLLPFIGGYNYFLSQSLARNVNDFAIALDHTVSDLSFTPPSALAFNVNESFVFPNQDYCLYESSSMLTCNIFGNAAPLVFTVADIQVVGRSIPEPSTLALLGLGVAGLVASRRRRLIL